MSSANCDQKLQDFLSLASQLTSSFLHATRSCTTTPRRARRILSLNCNKPFLVAEVVELRNEHEATFRVVFETRGRDAISLPTYDGGATVEFIDVVVRQLIEVKFQ